EALEVARVQSRVSRVRLNREAQGNGALRVSDTADADAMGVAGRGELQLAVLIETMRREGFEMTIGRPRVVMREDPETGRLCEPGEEEVIDVDEDHSGAVVEKLAQRRGELVDMRPSGTGRQRLAFHAPTRGRIGYHGGHHPDPRR